MLAVTTLAAFTMLAAVAVAAHWPQFGGDTGRSGYQPQAETGLPVLSQYAKTADTEKNVRTSIVATAGDTLARQRLVYGTQGADATGGGRVHLQELLTGAPVGTETGVNIDDAPGFDGDTFGDMTNNESVTPVDSSTGSAFGNLFVVHNDDNQDFQGTDDPRRGSDIALAQILAASGARGSGISADGETALGDNTNPANPNTIAFEIRSSPVITPADGSGTRTIYFTGFRGEVIVDANEIPCAVGVSFEETPTGGAEQLRGCIIEERRSIFKIVIADANTPQAEIIEFKMSANIATLDTNTPLALAGLKNAEGTVEDHVVVVTTGNTSQAQAFAGSTLSLTASSADLGDADMSAVSVPVKSDGSAPAEAPHLFVAAADTGTGTAEGDNDTWVYRLTQKQDDLDTLEFDPQTGKSIDLPGQPSESIAVTQLADQPGEPGRVLVLTSGAGGSGVYSLDATNLRKGVLQIPVTAVDQDRATPSASGDLLYYLLDNGDQVVRSISTLDEASADAGGFQENPANNSSTANSSIGQPAISNRYVVFPSASGAFVYRASDNSAPPGTNGPAYAIGDSEVKEGDSGEQLMTFEVRKFGPGTGTVEVSTEDGSAKAGEDYRPISGEVVTFGPGETEKNISVTVLSESNDENDETFFVRLSEPTGSNAAIIDDEGIGVIVSDDGRRTAPTDPVPLVDVSDVVAVEGGNAVFTVAMSNASGATVRIDFATADDNAKAGLDFGRRSGTLTFTPGQTVTTISVPIVEDGDNKEKVERFFVNLSNARNATLSDNQGSGFILEKGYDLRAPTRVSASTKPKLDGSAPFRFVTSGRVTLPSGVSRAQGCNGRISVQIKAIRKTISTRRTLVKSNCRYRSTVTFKERNRFSKSGVLTVRVRFQGNDFLLAKSAKPHTVRTK
jgi:hypothetical protein